MREGYHEGVAGRQQKDFERQGFRMKKIVAMLMVVVCCVAGLGNLAAAEGSTWYCEKCHENRTTAWCPICGASRPAQADTWICPECGKELPAEYNFCPDDRTERAISSGSWPVRTLDGIPTALRKPVRGTGMRMGYLGPSKQYRGAGGYDTKKVDSAIALFREGDYVLVELDYRDLGKRLVYFDKDVLQNYDVEEVILTAYSAKVISDVEAMFGPGFEYNVMELAEQGKSGRMITSRVTLNKGAIISVFFEVDGWVFAEFTISSGTVRAWLPANKIAEK